MASSSGCAPKGAGLSCPGAARKDGSASRSEPPAPERRFPRRRRLTARRQYSAVHEKGRRVSSPSFTLLGLPSAAGSPRIGITVSRKVGGAVERNRIKRIFREIFRYNRPALVPPLDLVVVARPGAADRTMRELEREFLKRFAELARRFEK